MSAQNTVADSLPLQVDELVENLRRQAREMQLENEIIPELRFREEIALGPLTSKAKELAKELKANAIARHKAPVRELNQLRKEEMVILINVKAVKEVKATKRDELGLNTKISSAKAIVAAYKWRRYEQLHKAGVSGEPLSTEDVDVEAHTAFIAAEKLLAKLKRNPL